MTELTIQNLTKSYGTLNAIDSIDLKAEPAELVALLGPSGCGKTTLLRTIAGFIQASAGEILVDSRNVTRLPPNKRNTGMVFQNYALFPNMTVAGNIAFGLEMRGVGQNEIGKRVGEAIALVSLGGYEERYPRELSGGQQQRVAVARALVVNPDVFLLDEPLSNLDAKLRQSVGQQLRALQKRLGLTTIFVTHDQKEALMIADRLVIMRAGRVIQEGSASELYDRPATHFVADFLGSSNILNGEISESGFTTSAGLQIRCTPFTSREGQGDNVLSIRPENVLLGSESDGLPNCFQANVRQAVYLGSVTELELELASGDRIVAHRQNRVGTPAFSGLGETLQVGWREDVCRLLIDDMND